MLILTKIENVFFKMRAVVLLLLMIPQLVLLNNAQADFSKFRGFTKGMQSFDVLAGQPTVFRYNYFEGWKRSFSFDAGYHFDGYVHIGANYSFYFYNFKDRLKKNSSFFNSLLFYTGPGLILGPDPSEDKSEDKLKIAVRGFAGAEYLFGGTNLSLKAEVAPAYYIEGEDDFEFHALVGLAYYFGFQKKKILKKAEPISDEEVDKEFQEFD